MKQKRSDAAAAAAVPAGQVVLDASALLAFLRRERGAEVVAPRLRGAMLSTVNYAEVLGKSLEAGVSADVVRALLDELEVRRVDFDQDHAARAAELQATTRALGLSLGDRACLALGALERAVVLTADRPWADLSLDGVAIHLIR